MALVVGLFLLLFVANAALLHKQSEIRKSFSFWLGRSAQKEEVARWATGDLDDLGPFLLQTPERKDLFSGIFADALGREPSGHEQALFAGFSLAEVSKHVYISNERALAIEQSYWDMLGRPPLEEDLLRIVRSRTPVSDLRAALNSSPERVTALKKTYRDVAQREATPEEVEEHLREAHGLGWLRTERLSAK